MNSSSLQKEYPYIYRGIVEVNEDPLSLGRCRVRVPAVHGSLDYSPESLPWARPITPFPVSKTRGSFCLPDVGETVWVFFEGGNKQTPVFLGGAPSEKDMRISEETVDIYKEGAACISYKRNGTLILRVGDATIEIQGSVVRVAAPEIRMKGSVTIEGDLQVSGDVSSSGATINGSLQVSGYSSLSGGHTWCGRTYG